MSSKNKEKKQIQTCLCAHLPMRVLYPPRTDCKTENVRLRPTYLIIFSTKKLQSYALSLQERRPLTYHPNADASGSSSQVLGFKNSSLSLTLSLPLIARGRLPRLPSRALLPTLRLGTVFSFSISFSLPLAAAMSLPERRCGLVDMLVPGEDWPEKCEVVPSGGVS
jgi:hypothetical protein